MVQTASPFWACVGREENLALATNSHRAKQSHEGNCNLPAYIQEQLVECCSYPGVYVWVDELTMTATYSSTPNQRAPHPKSTKIPWHHGDESTAVQRRN